MKVLILGGSRYLGPRVAKALADAGHEIAVFNRGRTRGPIPCEVTELKGDRESADDLAKAAADFRADAVVDSLAFSASDAKTALQAFGGRVKRYVVISSVSVYGRLRWIPAGENHPYYSDDRPWPGATGQYARGKAEMERTFLEAHAKEGFPVTFIRPSAIYGYSRLFNVWGYSTRHIARIRADKPVIVPDTGESLIQPVYIDDVAEAILRVLAADAADGEGFNCAGPEPMTLFDMFKAHGNVLGKKVEIVEIPALVLHAIDPTRCVRAATNLVYHHAYDITKARTLLGWNPRNFMSGLRETIGFLDRKGLIESLQEEDWEDRVINLFRTQGMQAIEKVGREINAEARITGPDHSTLPTWAPVPG